ncbi:GntR family transcriptional regulator [Paenibacillus eucommiae]|uniref:GntR family transcriptional regulator of arabinose operon n=1 Tax=Paenibacillus eucommiae TaxID=1355755 RepID=A0ABS4J689_9BACL|nr:GntR family transcriptional regulator [Paenibacillus eucommiae]MBP1995328.1 GntR family transcriptional regulator of arabinose operon [Paenibacillus eucommiae]
MLDQNKSTPLYLQIKEMVETMIERGELKPGDRVPTEAEMIEKYQVSRVTVKNAYKLLVEDGIIFRIAGKGSFVSTKEHLPDTNRDLKKIGYLSPMILDTFTMKLFQGVEEGCKEAGSMLMIRQVTLQSEERNAINDMIRCGAEGLIIFPVDGETYSEEILNLKTRNFPFVLVDRYLPGIKTNSVSSDNYLGGFLGTEYLIGKGHTEIGIISGTKSTTASSEDRFQGYLDAMKKNQLLTNPSYWLTRIDEFTYQQEDIYKQYIADWLSSNPNITAAFAFSSLMAEQVYQVARSMGKQIPEQLAILSYDNPDIKMMDASPFFSSIEQNAEEMGLQAVQVLMKSLHDPVHVEQRVIPVSLYHGLSS